MVINIKTYGGYNLKELKSLGHGYQGTVYKIDSTKCIKVFKKREDFIDELTTLIMCEKNPYFTKLYSFGEKYIVREYVEGISLDKYLKENLLSQFICQNILNIYFAMKSVGFKRLDSALFHIYITKSNTFKVIDTARAMKKEYTYPFLIIDGLNKLGYKNQFLDYLKKLKDILYKSCIISPKIQFIVVCGDSIAGSKDKEILKKQLYNFKSIINSYYPNVDIFPIIGNHEVNITPETDEYELIFQEVYNNFAATNYLPKYNKTAYYIDFEDTRLIMLNSFHPNEIHKITNSQLSWFDKISSINIKNKIVFVHSPAFPTGAHLGHCLDLYPDCRDAFIDIVEKNHINLIISGHEHNYSRRIIGTSNIIQIITGGGGEKLHSSLYTYYN